MLTRIIFEHKYRQVMERLEGFGFTILCLPETETYEAWSNGGTWHSYVGFENLKELFDQNNINCIVKRLYGEEATSIKFNNGREVIDRSDKDTEIEFNEYLLEQVRLMMEEVDDKMMRGLI